LLDGAQHAFGRFGVEEQTSRVAGGALGQATANFGQQVARYFFLNIKLRITAQLNGIHLHLAIGRKQAGRAGPHHII
jgi:hypothetical protein